MNPLFSTAFLNEVITNLKMIAPPDLFFLTRYFPNIQEPHEEEVVIDFEHGQRRLSPFVHYTQEGRIVEQYGYETSKLAPAYIKDKRIFDSQKAVKRLAGEPLFGQMTPAMRQQINIVNQERDQLYMLQRRLEWMAIQALLYSQVRILGDGIDRVVDYRRDPSLTTALAGALRWGEAGVDELADLERWSSEMLILSQIEIRDWIMTSDVWALLRESATFSKWWESLKGSQASAEAIHSPRLGVSFKGSADKWNFYVYENHYEDEAGVTQPYMPPMTLMGVGDPALVAGTRYFGLIRDVDALIAKEEHATTWTSHDPKVRQIMLESAPLPAPLRRNSSRVITVR